MFVLSELRSFVCCLKVESSLCNSFNETFGNSELRLVSLSEYGRMLYSQLAFCHSVEYQATYIMQILPILFVCLY